MPPVVETECVGRKQAPRADGSIQIDARIERFAVDLTTGLPIGERAGAGHATIGVQIAQFGCLRKTDAASIEGGARSQLVTPLAQGDLS